MTRATAAWLCLLAACGSPPPSVVIVERDAAVDADPGLPDLTVNALRAEVDLSVEQALFASDACELEPDEQCIAAPGLRRLLRFSVETPNIGGADLFVGAPRSDNPVFQYSACHEHYHFLGYAEYSLVDEQGNAALTGRKQAFCLVDTLRVLDDPDVPETARYRCNYQGIQRGWSDVYASSLPCQYLDITDVPDGRYMLRVHVNHVGTLAESDTTNNVAEIPVYIGAPALLTPTEPCIHGDDHSLAQPNRECEWAFAGTWDCTPGTSIRMGCADACGLGSCTGEPMLRICESGVANCSSGRALGHNEGDCASSCPRVIGIHCPASGRVDAYVASLHPGEPFTCNLELQQSP